MKKLLYIFTSCVIAKTGRFQFDLSVFTALYVLASPIKKTARLSSCASMSPLLPRVLTDGLLMVLFSLKLSLTLSEKEIHLQV